MAVLASIVGTAITTSLYLSLPAFVYVAWREVASPLTIFLAASATVGVMYDKFVIPDRTMNTMEKVAVFVGGGLIASVSLGKRAKRRGALPGGM